MSALLIIVVDKRSNLSDFKLKLGLITESDDQIIQNLTVMTGVVFAALGVNSWVAIVATHLVTTSYARV